AKAGLTGVNISGRERGKKYILETTGTGVAIFDYDNDGLQDILLVNAGRLDAPDSKLTHYLYRNLGGLRFRDVTAKAGILHTGWAQGVCAGDIDNDGYTDTFITHWGNNVLYRNKGDGTFQDETKARNLTAGKTRWSTGCAFLDYDRDGDLDLFVANYVDFDLENTPTPGESAQCMWKGLPVMCGPRGLPGETMTLYRNDGNGRFTDVSEESGITTEKNYYGFTALTSDFDNDGWPDIYVACDSTASLLYRNKGDGTFEEMGVLSGAAYNEDGREQAGMGATAGDYNGDGLLDIFKTNFSDDTPTLYKNSGDSNFEDATTMAGLAVNTKFLGWGTAFLDVDHDGWKDIIEVNGHVYPEVDEAGIGETFKQQRVLYWNRGDSQFFDMSAHAGPGILARHSSRGIAVGDLDNDGQLEIVVVNMHEPPSLLKNVVKQGNSLLVQALAPSGRDAIGTRVIVTSGGRKQIGEVRSGGYHISQGDFRVHFGLGSESKADISVRWPDGKTDEFKGVDANRWIVLRQGEGLVESRKLKLPVEEAAVTPN
ncbi:MAG: CRTAC1 family protein, partial [Bryobacteraceae bacterium]